MRFLLLLNLQGQFVSRMRNFYFYRAETRDRFVQDLNEKRLGTMVPRVPDTLLRVAMKAIARNHLFFLGRAENPFQNLRM